MSTALRSTPMVMLRNACAGFSGRLITLAVGLVMTPYLLDRLGPQGFGLWALVAMVTGVAGLLDLGLRTSFVRHLAAAMASDDRELVGRIVSTALAACLAFAIVVGVLFAALVPVIPPLLGIPDAWHAEAQRAFLLGLVGTLGGALLSVFTAVCDAAQRMVLTQVLGLLALLVGTVLTVLAVESGFGVSGAAAAQSSAIVLFHLACIPAASRSWGGLGLATSRIDRGVFAVLFAYGWRLHVSTVCTVVNRQFDKFLLARAAGLGSVATYEVAARAVGSVGTLQPYLAATLLPASSELHALDRIEDLRGLYRRSTRYLLLVGIPPFVFLASQSDAAITAWLGAPQPLAALFLLCLAPGYLVNTACNGMAFFCQGVGQPGIQARQSAWQLGINVVLSTLLLFAIGPLGAAIGTSIALIAGAIYFARHFHAHLGVSTLALLRESAAVPLLASFAGAALGAWAVAGSEAVQRGTALLQLGISGTVFAAVVAALYLASGQVGRVELRVLAGALRPGGPARTA